MQYDVKVTTNHRTVMEWARNRHGIPVRVSNESRKPGLGEIRIFFPKLEKKQDNWEEIPWDEFLNQFENRKLALEYKENDPNGDLSYYYQLQERVHQKV